MQPLAVHAQDELRLVRERATLSAGYPYAAKKDRWSNAQGSRITDSCGKAGVVAP